ncbi:MAG: rRNA maturation RNase YbeY [Candidatus Roizmanbacteria bacterium]|nr:rRNA maturation RNase YbeY [Candidatus Roizmanbacteria bacterium]
MINIFSSSRYKINKSSLEAFAQAELDKRHVAKSSALNIAFVGKRKMKDVANTYKHENIALPVLSFSYLTDPISTTDNVIGEVVICYPQAVLLAAEREKRVEKVMQSLIEHGIQNIFTK